MPLLPTDPLDIYSITGGLNTVKSGIRVDQTELRDCLNIRFRPIGGFKWRQGYETLGDAPGQAVTGLYMARFSNGTNTALRVRGTKIEYMSSLNGTWNDITASVSWTSGQDNVVTFATLNDTVIATNGVDNAVQISSAPAATTVGALPGSAIPLACYEHRGYMWYITSDKAFFSDINVPATVQTNNYVQPGGSKSGGNLTGGVDYNGKNYVFKRRGIYAVEFQPTQVDSSGTLFPFTTGANPVVPGIGTQAHRTIVKFTTPETHKNPGQELVFFVDQYGVPRIFDGATTLPIGTSILTSRDENIVSLANIDRSRLAYSWAVNDETNNLIYLFMSSSGQTKHDICWVLDYTNGFAWARDSYYDTFNAGAIFEDTTGMFRPYFGNYTGQVMKMNSTQTDNGQAITSYATSGDLFKGSPVILSKWLYLEMRGATGSDTQAVTLSFYADGEDSPSITGSLILFKQNQSTWDNVTWDQFNWVYSGLTTKSAEINTEAKTLRIRFSNSTSGNTCTCEGFSLFVLPEGWKQES